MYDGLSDVFILGLLVDILAWRLVLGPWVGRGGSGVGRVTCRYGWHTSATISKCLSEIGSRLDQTFTSRALLFLIGTVEEIFV